MRAMLVALFLLPAVLSPTVLAEDKFVGAIWNVKVRSEQTGKFVEIEPIRCTKDGKVYRAGRVVGSHRNMGLNEVEMVIDKAQDPKLNGKWKANRVKKNGHIWQGIYTRKNDGKEFEVVLTLKND